MRRLILILIPFIITLSSCSADNAKKAYCFSMVFERDKEQCFVTAYCKTAKEDTSGEMTDIQLRFNGNDFREALDDTSTGDLDIYFGSVCAYYISPKLSDGDIREISLLLFDNAGYRTDNHIYNTTENTPSELLHTEASLICSNEGIKKTDMHFYSKTLSFFRKTKVHPEGYRKEK